MGPLARTPAVLALLAALATGAACSGPAASPASEPPSPAPTSPIPTPSDPPEPTPTEPDPEPDPEPEAPERPPLVRVSEVDPQVAVQAVRHLAGTIGPRHGTSPEYRRAADWVARRLAGTGLEVRRQEFPVPGGVSWGVPVAAGRSVNLVAAAPGVDPTEPHLVVGAHLDTVPQAPGAEDNASGVGALLAVAEAVQGRRTRLPVVLVAFGAEEPRGPTDDDHHYGSRVYVDRLTPAERDAMRGMVSLDRVGVGTRMPVCSAGDPDSLRAQVLAAARRAAAAPLPCAGNRSSDHWSFVRDGLPGVRLGSTPYAGYHSAGDVPAVVRTQQLARAARTTVAWLRGP
jgi:aminopeptidase YwaD